MLFPKQKNTKKADEEKIDNVSVIPTIPQTTVVI